MQLRNSIWNAIFSKMLNFQFYGTGNITQLPIFQLYKRARLGQFLLFIDINVMTRTQLCIP